MSNLNNKHLPSDIDSLTRKDLVAIYFIHVEEYQKATKHIAELEEREKHLLQVIYNASRVSFEAGACYQKSDFHSEAANFAKSIQAKQLKEQGEWSF